MWNKVKKDALFKSKAKAIIYELDIDHVLCDCNNKLLNRISEKISKGSGWTIKSIDKHELNFIKYEPLSGSSFLPQPTWLTNKKSHDQYQK